MSQSNLAYDLSAQDAAGLPLALSIFADSSALRDEMREDALAAGFRIADFADATALLDDRARALGGVVLLDCPDPDAAGLAALARLDLRAAHCGAQLIVSTSLAALDGVFGCLDQSRAQILVDPRRGERLVALGRALTALSARRLRELSREDRLALLRLTEQISQLTERLEGLPGGTAAAEGGAFRFESPGLAFAGAPGNAEERLVRAPRPPLPDPRLVRRIIRQRQLRHRFFTGDIFADPAWDMLLDLTAARAEHARVSVTSLCIAACVPPTTALRWIGQMVDSGVFERVEDEADRRRAFIQLSDDAADSMARYFAELGQRAAQLI